MRAENTCSGREIEACARVSRGENGGWWGSLSRCVVHRLPDAPWPALPAAVARKRALCTGRRGGGGGQAVPVGGRRRSKVVTAPSNLSPWIGC